MFISWNCTFYTSRFLRLWQQVAHGQWVRQHFPRLSSPLGLARTFRDNNDTDFSTARRSSYYQTNSVKVLKGTMHKCTNLFAPFPPAKILADSSQVYEVDLSPSNSADHCTDDLAHIPDICLSLPRKRWTSAVKYTDTLIMFCT